ncbi:MAG: GAF domain-containing protein [Myxococcota bacterium]
MPKFEVHIPAAEVSEFNVTLKVDADNWMAALKTGMHKLGEQGASVQNVLVDIQEDNSIHVTESSSGRVFRIRELSDAEAAAASVKKPPVLSAPPPSARTFPWGSSATQPARPRSVHEAVTEPNHKVIAEPDTLPPSPAATLPGVHPELLKPTPTRIIERARRHEPDEVVELEKPTQPVLGSIGRPKPTKKGAQEDIEDVLAEVFDQVQNVYGKKTEEEALYFLLDLALQKIPAESGTVYRADATTGDLSFAAVRGPKAKELLAARVIVPSGTGIAGFAANEGVSVAVSDVEKDSRFYAAISEKLKYEVKSILCSPMMTHGRTFGCLQLLNKSGSAVFSAHEVGLLSYVAHQAALFLNSRL